MAPKEDCYNRGDVSASQNAGGVAGLLNDSGASIKRCYTTTATAIGKKSSGTVETATVFCQGSDSLATTKTEAEMKSADFVAALGSAFLAGGSLNDGYPILDFQVVKYPVTFTVTWPPLAWAGAVSFIATPVTLASVAVMLPWASVVMV